MLNLDKTGWLIHLLHFMIFLVVGTFLSSCKQDGGSISLEILSEEDILTSLAPRPSNGPIYLSAPEMASLQGETHWLEAEFPTSLISPMMVEGEITASENAFIWTPPDTSESGGQVNYSINITVPGLYAVWARVSGLNYTTNSFSVQFNKGLGNETAQFSWGFAPGIWHWERVHPANQSNAISFNAGEQLLDISTLEKGSKIDKILITRDLTYSPNLAEKIEIDNVWSGHPVGFSLVTGPERQYVGYYDQNRQMVIASRKLDESNWQYFKVNSYVGWDSHNYIAMAIDADNHLHVSGNMHNSPLQYLMTRETGDISSLVSVNRMLGLHERNVTYPNFFYFKGYLAFHYRNGGSGQGWNYFNVFDESKDRWFRFTRENLFDGRDNSAYYIEPFQDSQGIYHVVWMWRSTADAATCHNISHAQSSDLIHWETSQGKSISLPITPGTGEIIDPVPPGGGLLNSRFYTGFDSQGQLVVTYHKYDSNGYSQIYNARLEQSGWTIYQMSDWQSRWDFGGIGSLPALIPSQEGVRIEKDEALTQTYRGFDRSGIWQVDEDSMKVVGSYTRRDPIWIPSEIRAPVTDCPECPANQDTMDVRYQFSEYQHPLEAAEDFRYFLRWETLGANRDQPRSYIPQPSKLYLYASVPSYTGEPAENLP